MADATYVHRIYLSPGKPTQAVSHHLRKSVTHPPTYTALGTLQDLMEPQRHTAERGTLEYKTSVYQIAVALLVQHGRTAYLIYSWMHTGKVPG